LLCGHRPGARARVGRGCGRRVHRQERDAHFAPVRQLALPGRDPHAARPEPGPPDQAAGQPGFHRAPLRQVHPVHGRLPDAGVSGAGGRGLAPLHLLPHDREQGSHPARAAGGRRQPRLRVRHLPRRVPLEPVRQAGPKDDAGVEGRHSGDAAARAAGANPRALRRGLSRHRHQADQAGGPPAKRVRRCRQLGRPGARRRARAPGVERVGGRPRPRGVGRAQAGGGGAPRSGGRLGARSGGPRGIRRPCGIASCRGRNRLNRDPRLGRPKRRGHADRNVKKAHPLALAAVLAAESVLFLVMTGRHSAWVYPRWYDQLQYLGQAYDGYEYMRLHGFAAAAWHTLTLHPAQGSLHAFFALLVFAAAGPSRGAALAVNLLAFLALQGATFFAVRRISGSFPLALAAVALLAAVRFPWSVGPACAVDFRLDWMAACAYGVALAAAVAADGFRSTRRAVLFGAAAGVVILIRHLTAVYFSLIFVALMSWLLARADRRAGCGRLGLAALTAAALSAPELWFSRKAIYGYYWLDQLVGAERGL